MKKKKIIVAGVVLVVAVLGIRLVSGVLGGGAAAMTLVETQPLAPMDLADTVSVTGTVESEQVEKVYTKLNYPVKTVHVEVGDVVAEGDILCELDTSDLESNIAQQKATVNFQQQSTNLSVAEAKKQYENAQRAMEMEYNADIQLAEQTVQQLEAALEKAGIALREARSALDDVDKDEESDYTLASMRRNRDAAYVDYETAKSNLDYAKTSLSVAKRKAKEQLSSFEDSVTSAQLGNTSQEAQWIAIRQLEQDLAEAVITAPVSGTVTAVYATQGAVPSGLLVVIEDTGRLKVATTVKEYDLASVSVGNPVEIRSDATGDTVFDGEIAKIAPTSTKNASGESVDATEAEFQTDVAVTSQNTGLRIGMKARMDIVVEAKSGIYAVPYEAVVFDATGEEIVYIVATGEEGATIAQPVVVETGMENDFYVEISAPELTDGVEIITNPEIITAPGQEVVTMAGLMAQMEAAQSQEAEA